MGTEVVVTPLAEGMYRVDHDGHQDTIYVATAGAVRWIFWNGRVFQQSDEIANERARTRARTSRSATVASLLAPMPARVVKVLVQPGAAIKKGDTIVLLEAMKMELPVRAPDNATVIAVHCHEGELVQADAPLVDLG